MKSLTAQLRQSNTGDAVTKKKKKRERGKSGEVENEVFIENDITYILGSELDVKKQKKQKKNKQRYMKEFRRQKKEQKAKKGTGPQLRCLALQNSLRKRTLPPPRR